MKVAAQYSNPILVGSVGAVVRMRRKIPLVANYGDPDFAREFGLARKAFGFCEDLVMARGNTHAVIYWDEVLGEYIRHGFPVKNMLFLPNGGYEDGFVPPSTGSPEVVALRNQLGLEGKPIVLYAGQITRVYRLDILVAAAPYIISKVPDVRFLIVGSGKMLPVMKEWVRKAHLDDHFVFTGAVPYDEMSPYVVMSDICVNLLNDWCMGTKVVMYMVHRKAVVAGGSWYDRYKLFLRNGDNSFLVPADAGAFGKEVVVALKDQELRRRVGESAWRTVSPYTWDRHAEDTMKLLKDSVSNRKNN
jgi:glycosyltransferase involved in cell wall biosynthesis